MGKSALTTADLAGIIATAAFTASGQATTAVELFGSFNMDISGTFVGTVQMERSFNGGASFNAVAEDGAGTAAAYTAPVSLTAKEIERGTLYRLRCTAYTSGTANVRLSQ